MHADEGIYRPDGEAKIIKETKKALGKYFRRNRQNEVLADIISSTLTDIEETPPHIIAMKNGVFNLKTEKFEEFGPKYFILNALPVKYDPEADCPRIKNFISEVIDSEDVPVLREIVGYCLHRSYPIHVAAMFIGEGANSKSTFMSVLVAMLGIENISTLPLQALEQRFAVVALHGKLANICPDLSDKALRKTGLFKMLTGGDNISGEYKFKETFTFKNYAKLIFSANKIPETRDDTTAFFRRWLVINFPNQFLPDDPKTDINLTEKLTTEEELSGFFNWALEGLKRLLKNGRFSTGKSVEETRQQYLRASDPVKAFVMDRVEFHASNVISKDEVYKAFIEYCQEMKLPTVAKNVFSMKLQEHMPNVTETTKQVLRKRIRCWRDIAVVKEGEHVDINKNAIDYFEDPPPSF